MLIFSGFGAKNIHLKNPIDILFTFWPIIKQTFDVQKNVEGLEWPAIDALRIGYHTNPQVKMCFVNKQLTYYLWRYDRTTSPTPSKHYIHWRRSALSSAGALQGGGREFLTLYTINFRGLHKSGGACAPAAPPSSAPDYIGCPELLLKWKFRGYLLTQPGVL